TVSSDERVFVTEDYNHRVQYFSKDGSFLGTWGALGRGNGEFNQPWGIAAANSGKSVYVADKWNDRVQYFKRVEDAVAPSSLGSVKALFH
ncbi:MAG TPA: 6-bladed beta-propeller, partial [bacterium]|nr:6-bladed beta-propeller [bacterium]